MITISKKFYSFYRWIDAKMHEKRERSLLSSVEISQTYEILRDGGRCGLFQTKMHSSLSRDRPPHPADYGYGIAFYDRLGAPARFHQASIIGAITIREMFSRVAFSHETSRRPIIIATWQLCYICRLVRIFHFQPSSIMVRRRLRNYYGALVFIARARVRRTIIFERKLFIVKREMFFHNVILKCL